MRKIYTTFLFILILGFKAKADFCISSIENDLQECDLIFIGKVVDSSNDFWLKGYRRTITNFQIIKSYQGGFYTPCYGCINTFNLVSIFDSPSMSSIGFKKDSVYLVLAYKTSGATGTYWTSSCTSTGLVSSSNELINTIEEALGTGYTHPDSMSGAIKIRNEELEQKEDTFNSLIKEKDVKIHNQNRMLVIGFVILLITLTMFIREKTKSNTT